MRTLLARRSLDICGDFPPLVSLYNGCFPRRVGKCNDATEPSGRRFHISSTMVTFNSPAPICLGRSIWAGGYRSPSGRGICCRSGLKQWLQLEKCRSKFLAFLPGVEIRVRGRCLTSTSGNRTSKRSVSANTKSASREQVGTGQSGNIEAVDWSDNPGESVEDDDEDEDIVEDDDFVDDEGEEEGEVVLGDGGDGGGVVLGQLDWGKKALEIAEEVLGTFGSDFTIYAFKARNDGQVHLRLDKLSDRYGSPDTNDIVSFSTIYGKRLEEAGEDGLVPDNLALEVSSPGAERVVQIPKDLLRFKGLPMYVRYVEGSSTCSTEQPPPKDGVFDLEAVDIELGYSVWKIANVRQNRDLAGKGRGLTRKQRDWRAQVPFSSLLFVKLHMDI